MLLEKSPLAANAHAMYMKGKVVIQSAFDVEYTCVLEHMVYVSHSSDARMNVLGMDFLAKFGEIINLRNSMLFLTAFPGICVKLSPLFRQTFPLFFTSEFCKVVTRCDDCTLLNARFDVLS